MIMREGSKRYSFYYDKAVTIGYFSCLLFIFEKTLTL